MWPNDADGNAIRSTLGPAADEGRVHHRRPRCLHRRHQRLLVADQQVQVSKTARSSTPSRSRLTLQRSGSKLPSRATSRRSRRSPRPDSSRPRSRRWARSVSASQAASTGAPTFPYTSSLTRSQLRGSGDRLSNRLRASSGTSSSAPAWRSSTWQQQRSRRRRIRTTRRGCRTAISTLGVMTPVGQLAVGQGAQRQRRRHADHRRSVGQGAVRPVQARIRYLRALLRHKRPDRSARCSPTARERRTGRFTHRDSPPRSAPAGRGGIVQTVRLPAGARPRRLRGRRGRSRRHRRPEWRRQDHFAERAFWLTRAQRRHACILGAEDITHMRAEQRCRRGVGRAFQIPRPFGAMTVLENVLVGASYGAGLADPPRTTSLSRCSNCAG